MATLENKISTAKSSVELNKIVDSIKKQENGFKNSLASHLLDAFWYSDLINDINKQKEWILKVCMSYPDSLKETI